MKLGNLYGRQEILIRGKLVGWIIFEGTRPPDARVTLDFEPEPCVKISKKTFARILAVLKEYARELSRGTK